MIENVCESAPSQRTSKTPASARQHTRTVQYWCVRDIGGKRSHRVACGREGFVVWLFITFRRKIDTPNISHRRRGCCVGPCMGASVCRSLALASYEPNAMAPNDTADTMPSSKWSLDMSYRNQSHAAGFVISGFPFALLTLYVGPLLAGLVAFGCLAAL